VQVTTPPVQLQPLCDEQVAALSCAHGVTVPTQLVEEDHEQPWSALQLVGSRFWAHC
jgi:hypothetical protein